MDCGINERMAEKARPVTEADDDASKTAYMKQQAAFCKTDAVVGRGLTESRNEVWQR